MKAYRAAQMDKVTLGATRFALGLLLSVILLALLARQVWLALVLTGFSILLVALCWQVKGRRYEIGEHTIVVVRGRPFRDTIIPLSEVREIRRFSDFAAHRQTLRLCGVGGVFSFNGTFWNKEIGEFHAMVTNMGEAVYIEAKEKFAISPENPDEFIVDVKNAMEGNT